MNKVWLVTGANRGIGHALVEADPSKEEDMFIFPGGIYKSGGGKKSRNMIILDDLFWGRR